MSWLTPNASIHYFGIGFEFVKLLPVKYVLFNCFNPILSGKLYSPSHIIPTLKAPFDLVFIDADKQNYSLYYDLVFDKVRSGGFIFADNVLWSGKIIEEKKDKDTQKLADFNTKIQQDNRIENVIVSIRDGILMARKK